MKRIIPTLLSFTILLFIPLQNVGAIGGDIRGRSWLSEETILKIKEYRNMEELKDTKPNIVNSKQLGLKINFGGMKSSISGKDLSFGKWEGFSYSCGSKSMRDSRSLYREYRISKEKYIPYETLYAQFSDQTGSVVSPYAFRKDIPYSWENLPGNVKRIIESGLINGKRYFITGVYWENTSCYHESFDFYLIGKKYNYKFSSYNQSDREIDLPIWKKLIESIEFL